MLKLCTILKDELISKFFKINSGLRGVIIYLWLTKNYMTSMIDPLEAFTPLRCLSGFSKITWSLFINYMWLPQQKLAMSAYTFNHSSSLH